MISSIRILSRRARPAGPPPPALRGGNRSPRRCPPAAAASNCDLETTCARRHEMSKLTRGNSNALTGTRRGMLAAPDFQASHLSGACAGGGDPARQLRGNHQSRRGLHPGGEQLNHMAIGGTATRFSDGLRFAPPKIARGGASHAEACALFGMLGAAACFERTAYRHPRNRAPGCRSCLRNRV